MIDSVTGVRLDVRGFLRALADGWQSLLPSLDDLNAEEAAAYLHAQGYSRARDVLAEATAWCEEALGATPLLLRGERVQPSDERTLQAQAIARFSYFSDAEVRRTFTLAYVALARMLAFLPDAALEQPEVYRWLYTTIVDHFNERRPPQMQPVAQVVA